MGFPFHVLNVNSVFTEQWFEGFDELLLEIKVRFTLVVIQFQQTWWMHFLPENQLASVQVQFLLEAASQKKCFVLNEF